jgi:hypothetical protein
LGNGDPNRRKAAFCYQRARVHRFLGRTDRAIELCRAATALADYNKAHALLAAIELPGPDYFSLLARIHAYLRPGTYVEIGVARGESLRLAHADTDCIGIDPAPRPKTPPGPRQRIFAEKSDDFFASRDVIAELGGRRIELAFIDGMHRFEFALRDFINIERNCEPSAIVLIHDCYPLDAATATRERNTSFWSGDIWRLILALKKYRPDLKVHTIGTAPTGLGVITNLDPSSRVLSGARDRIITEYLATDYSMLKGRKSELLGLYPNHWPAVRALIDSSQRR